MYSQEAWYACKGSLENPSRAGVNSGRSLSSSSESGGAGADEDDEEALGLRVSNSVVFVVVLDLGASSFAFLMGCGSGLAGMYYRISVNHYGNIA